MNAVTTWFRGHRTLASVVTISLVVGVPLTFAVINPGYPVSDVQLTARDVWVTKKSSDLAGRMNTQISQLDSSVYASDDFDVVQYGPSVFLDDETSNALKQVDPSLVTTSPTATTKLPPGAKVYLDGGILAIEGQGRVWRIPVSGTLAFDYQTTPSAKLSKLAADAQVSVERDGTVDIATTAGTLYQLDAQSGQVRTSSIPRLRSYELSSVGTRPVILDRTNHRIIDVGGGTFDATGALSIQQPGDSSSYALLETATGLLRVDLGSGAKTSIPDTSQSSATPTEVAQPVHMESCDNGVWSNVAYAIYSCVGKSTVVSKLGSQLEGDTFKFRVNQTSVALNDVDNGFSWLSGSAKSIDNWNTVPPQQQSQQTGTTKGTNTTYIEKPPTFVPQNHPPVANDDVIGVRGAGTTALPVLENDTDPDGDVLTVTSIGAVPTSFGVIQLGAGGESPQFTPAPGASGSQSVSYSISDGRGGTASAIVKISIVPDSIDNPPASTLAASVLVEQGQTVTYNVLADWSDPDGDAMQLINASVDSGDSVRFTPDGYITFRSSTGVGVKKVTYTVEDSSSQQKKATGTLTVDVKAPGTTVPLAESDYASGFVGEPIDVSPLINDRSPSGQALHLLSVKEVVGSGPAPVLNTDKGTVQFNENQPGSYEFEYTETAGTSTKINDAFIRVDAISRPTAHLPPVAVSDVAYLTYPGSVTVPVLDNDISPEGLVLGVQSITAPSVPGLTAQLQSNTTIKVTATGTSPGDKPVVIDYTISDGTATSTASLTIVAVSQLINHQAPIAADDFATVRAGEVATVSVLDNDVDPDGAPMSLAPKLIQLPTAGLAFVTGNDVRYQAPSTPGQYAAVYSVVDTAGESSTARVVFTVTPATSKNDRAPVPQPIVSRVFAGGTVRVQVPLAGIDPDGDTVLLQSIAQNPQLGKILDVTSTYFDYQANKASYGTDVFNYQVVDPFGKTGIATASIGVIPRAGLLLPTAIDDNATLKPGTQATVDVLANDSDPNGYPISVEPKSLVNLGAKGVSASVVDNNVVLHASSTVGDYSIRYSITDGHTKSVSAVIHIKVSKTAVELPPVAVDHVLQQKDVASGKVVNVSAREGAQDPSGVVSSLSVSLPSTQSPVARLTGGHIAVTPGKSALTIAYTLTDPHTHLSSTAFVLVPPVPKAGWNLAPYIRKDLKQQVVEIDTPTKFALSNVVTAPSGKLPVRIIDKGSLTATHGAVTYTDSGDFTFTPAKDYAGPAAITFDAADGAHPSHSATLTLPVTVGDPSGKDLKPTFTTIQAQAAQGATTPINLINATGNSKYVTYTVTGGNSTVSAHTSGAQGGTLEVAAADNAQEGSSVVFHVTLTTPSPSNYVIQGEVVVKVVSSLAPLAQAVTDTANIKRGVTTTINVLANDVNPFPGTALKVVGVTIDNSGTGATFSYTSSAVTITPGPSFIGNVSLHYTEQDKTGDKDREVTGEILITVWDVPDQQAAPTVSSFSDQTVTIDFNTPPSDNGSSVTSYTVRVSSTAGTPAIPRCTAGVDCTFTGLTNGALYTFYVSATNAVGTSQESLGVSARPYGTPSQVQDTYMGGGLFAPTTLTIDWSAPANDGGGDLTYQWAFTAGSTASGSTASTTVQVAANSAGTYDAEVRACTPANDGQLNCGLWKSLEVYVGQPSPSAITEGGRLIGQQAGTGYYFYYLDLSYSNFPTNSVYSVNCYANNTNGGTSPYKVDSLTTSSTGTGTVETTCQGTEDGPGSAGGWFYIQMIGSSGTVTTPKYTPTNWQ